MEVETIMTDIARSQSYAIRKASEITYDNLLAQIFGKPEPAGLLLGSILKYQNNPQLIIKSKYVRIT